MSANQSSRFDTSQEAVEYFEYIQQITLEKNKQKSMLERKHSEPEPEPEPEPVTPVIVNMSINGDISLTFENDEVLDGFYLTAVQFEFSDPSANSYEWSTSLDTSWQIGDGSLNNDNPTIANTLTEINEFNIPK